MILRFGQGLLKSQTVAQLRRPCVPVVAGDLDGVFWVGGVPLADQIVEIDGGMNPKIDRLQIRSVKAPALIPDRTGVTSETPRGDRTSGQQIELSA